MYRFRHIFAATALALLVMVSVAQPAQASYYSFIRDYLQQQQPVPQPEPKPQPEPEPQHPQSPVNDFWARKAESRQALLQPQPQPGPAPQPDPWPQPVPEHPPQPQPGPGVAPSSRELAMLAMVNQERTSRGLQPLAIDNRLVELARIKSADLRDNNYFAHHSPILGSAFDMMRSAGIEFIRAGENLSKSSGVQVSHYRLMNSPAHRANLLNPHYTHIGIGVADIFPSGVIVTQMFIQAP